MSDNVQITEGVGRSVAADEIAGVLHQKVKVEFGGDDQSTQVSPTTPLPVAGPLVTERYTQISAAYPDDHTEVYTYKNGTSTVATVTITYTDSTKAIFTSAVRT